MLRPYEGAVKGNSDNLVAVAAAVGIEAVIATMQAHKTSALLQQYSCGTLQNLAFNPDKKVAISAAGGIEALATARRTKPASSCSSMREGRCITSHATPA